MSSFYIACFELFITCVMLFSAKKLYFVSVFSHNITEELVDSFYKRTIDAGISYRRESFNRVAVLALFVSGLFGFILSPIFAGLAPLVLVVSFYLYTRYRSQQIRQQQRYINDEVCYSLARSLRAGHSIESALIFAYELYPNSLILKNIEQHINAGSSLDYALSEPGLKSIGGLLPAEKMLCATISIAQSMGGNSARIFDRIGDSFHQSYELQADISSSLSQVKMSAIVISSLPLAMFFISLLMRSESTTFLFTNPVGFLCLLLGLLLESLGIFWMKKQVDNGVMKWR